MIMTAQISVDPNPFKNVLQVKIEGEKNNPGHCVIRLIDQKGNILRMLGISLNEGPNKIFIDRLQALSAGNYYLDVKNTEGENIFSARLVKE
jgi:hypothetical protein